MSRALPITVPCVLTLLTNTGLSLRWDGYLASRLHSCSILSSPSSCSFPVRPAFPLLALQMSVIRDGLCSAYRQLRRPRRQVELARRDDPNVYVSPYGCTGLFFSLLTTRDNQACISFSVLRFGITPVSQLFGVDVDARGVLTCRVCFRYYSRIELLKENAYLGPRSPRSRTYVSIIYTFSSYSLTL